MDVLRPRYTLEHLCGVNAVVHVGEGRRTLARKSSTKHRRQPSPQDIDGKVHKRPDQSDSEPVLASEATEQVVSSDVDLDDDDQIIAPARQPASDATVKKVTYGLMRLQSRRHARVVARRVLLVSLVAASLAGIWYYFGDRIPTNPLQDYWESIVSRLFPGEAESAP